MTSISVRHPKYAKLIQLAKIRCIEVKHVWIGRYQYAKLSTSTHQDRLISQWLR